MKKLTTYFLFFFLFALLGFTREFLFVNINDRLYSLYYGHHDSLLPNSLEFLRNYNYSTIYYGKYILTFVYYLAYLGATYWAIKKLCNDTKPAKQSIYLYVFIFTVSFLVMLYNYFVNHQLDGEEYTFSRWLMGIAQSPLVAFFMIASNTLYQKIKNENPIF